MVRPQEPQFCKETQNWYYIDFDNKIHKSEDYMHVLVQYAIDMKQYCNYLENLINHQDDEDDSPWVFK